MNDGKPRKPDSWNPFARHDGDSDASPRTGGLDDDFLSETADPTAVTPDDALTAFGSEPGSALFPPEPASPSAGATDDSAQDAPLPRTPPHAEQTATPDAAKSTTGPVRSPSILASPLWIALAAFGGVAAGMGYAHYVRAPVAPVAQPAVTEAPQAERSAGSTGTTPPRSQSPASPVTAAPKPAPEQRLPPAPRPSAATEPGAPAATNGLSTVPGTRAIEPPAALTPPRVESELARDQRLIRELLEAYRGAYERLDPAAVAAVWPDVDTRALARAFSTVDSHRITFDRCDITITGTVAVARCDGVLSHTPAVGESVPQSRAMSWAFALERASGQWKISGMNSR